MLTIKLEKFSLAYFYSKKTWFSKISDCFSNQADPPPFLETFPGKTFALWKFFLGPLLIQWKVSPAENPPWIVFPTKIFFVENISSRNPPLDLLDLTPTENPPNNSGGSIWNFLWGPFNGKFSHGEFLYPLPRQKNL